MDTNVVDKLYKIYTENNSSIWFDVFKSALYGTRDGNEGERVIEEFTNFINEQAKTLPSYFKSQEKNSTENFDADNFTHVVDDIAYIADLYIDDIKSGIEYDSISKELEKEFEEDNFNIYNETDNDLDEELQETSSRVFSLYTELIKQSYEKYNYKVPGLTPKIVEQITNLISFVQEKKSLKRIYGDNNWKTIEPGKLFITLKDFHKNKPEIFKIDSMELTSSDFQENCFFDEYIYRLLNNRINISKMDFVEFRPSMISKSAIATDIKKLIFARNFIEFAKSGIMPSPDGYIDFLKDQYNEHEVIAEFKKIYRNSFDNKKFVDMQGNFIFNLDQYILDPERIEKVKGVIQGKSLSIGCLLSTTYMHDTVEYGKQYMLIHVNISDVTNDKSTYEIQLNILPEGELQHRIQLVRFDNWKDPQYHKNLGNKLQTTTHIHLYNPLDLLRGKKNGAFDIAFNISDKSTDFESALDTFVAMISNDEKLQSTINSIMMKSFNEAKRRVGESESTSES